jgi:DNA-directed RNA polymerase specialized sigma24 family protein
LEKKLAALNHSLRSNYIIKFLDPAAVENLECESATAGRGPDYYRLVATALKVLTPAERYYVVKYYRLSDLRCLTQREIAKRKGVTQHTVYYHIKRAKDKLRKELLRLGVFKFYS